MSEQPPEINEVESALKSLRPAGQLRRDQLMYRAGKASVARRGWMWPASTAAMTAATIALAAALLLRPQPVPTERIVLVPIERQVKPAPLPETRQAEQPTVESLPEDFQIFTPRNPSAVWQMQQEALRWGVENLPLPALPAASASQPQTVGSLMDAYTKDSSGKAWLR